MIKISGDSLESPLSVYPSEPCVTGRTVGLSAAAAAESAASGSNPCTFIISNLRKK